MPNRKHLAGGKPNPNYRVRSGSRASDRAFLPDGIPNPKYRKRTGHATRDHKHLANGELNPGYRPRTGRISKFKRGEFIAWDGEGITTKTRTEKRNYQCVAHTVEVDEQSYALLANSAGNSLYDASGLGTIEQFEFLLAEARAHPHAIHVIYGGSYDFEMMLKDLSVWHLANLHAGEWVRWGAYKIQYRPRRSLFIGRVDREPGEVGSITIFDVIGFFQSSFVDAIKRWCPDNTDLPLIAEGKQARGGFSDTDREFLVRYNDAELRALVELMRRFHTAVTETGYTLRRFDGAGALAAAMMLKHNVRSHMARRVVTENGVRHEYETVPGFVRDAALRAMAGGRIECPKIGNHQHPLWHGDINSAYPKGLLDLPRLADGTWTHHTNSPTTMEQYALYHVTWDLPTGHALYPFFYRDPHGHISYPPNGEGWYWGPEIIAATKHHPTGIRIHDWIEFTPARDDKPFAFVQAEADRRFQYQRDGNAAEKPLKLGINSLYGKTAQQKGAHYTTDGRLILPRYFQPEWAGYVTAHCRAEMYDTAMQDPDSVIMIATDGIYATHALNVPEGDSLGQWKIDQPAWMITVQSGVYFVDDHGQTRICYRGFDPGSITPQRVLNAWKHGHSTLPCTINRFITLGAALKSRAPIKHIWRTWRRSPRTLRLDGYGTKRTQLTKAALKTAATGVVDTHPIPNPFTGECSQPTKVRWLYN